MMREQEKGIKKQWKGLIWSIAKADLLSLVVYLVFFNLINALPVKIAPLSAINRP